MSIFTRKDRTKPLPPPEGYKWEIHETLMVNLATGREVLALELWPADPQVRRPRMARISSYFEQENEILRASKDALASYEKTIQNEAFKADLGVIPIGDPRPPKGRSGVSR